MRPIYESPETTADEERFKSVVEPLWGCNLTKLSRAYHLDFSVERNGIVIGFVEFKRRHHNYGQFPTVILSMLKLRAMRVWRELLLSSVFAVEFNDGIYFARHPFPYKVEMGGNLKRNDGLGDYEPVAHIPITKFEQLT